MWNVKKTHTHKKPVSKKENRVVVAKGYGREIWGELSQRTQTFSYKKNPF